ncbi:MAG: adenylyltransferase/cytidyltransferase family protein [Euryarchaeota archaeon]|nr:adenylyltransferase/cytidyltransferase family protein [Euryarchaeota archaeon]MDE1835615.1 adenylyltransferase/cytidyltransferase family protein [Euryarchaeota archaeon]
MVEPLPVGVYWGRFNPPHRGHLSVVRRFHRDFRLTVVIGSAEHRDERRNPFSGRERQQMFEAYLAEVGILDVRVTTLRDGPTLDGAIHRLVRRCHPDVILLSSDKGRFASTVARKVRVVRFARRGVVSSTRIRAAIATGRPDWERLTGRSVVRLIHQFGGPARIRRAHRSRRRSAGVREGRRRRTR